MFPKMRRSKQALSPEEMESILLGGTSGVLALQGEDGYPNAVPLSYVYTGGKFYFHCAKAGHKIDAVRRSPKASFCVIGQDRVGIIAAVCGKLAELNVNILDITQTILKGNFTMVMTVDAGQANVGFEQLAAGLEALGEQMGLVIRIQREEIFDAMHRI